MTIRFAFVLLLLSLNACLPATTQETLITSSETTTTVQYAPSDTNFPNPERGFYKQLAPFWIGEQRTPLEPNELLALRSEGISMLRTYFIIDEFIDRPLSEEALREIEANFSTVRQAGLKIFPRFSYNFPNDANGPKPDASLQMVLTHIDQLTPLLRNHADVIAFIEAGFIGAWGEWHSSGSGLVNERVGDESTLNDASRQILARLLDALPESRMVAIRRPMDKRVIFGERPLSEAEAFSAMDKARVGHHNDCFLASETDAGTYPVSSINAEKSYLNQENKYVLQGGETCRNNGVAEPYVPCNNALKELTRMRFTTLNIGYHPDVIRRWQFGGCLETIKLRLGYRYRLLESTLPTQALSGTSFNLSMTLKNEGFGGLYNSRIFEVVLRNQNGQTYNVDVTNQSDPRFWLPDGNVSVNLNISLANVPAGPYEVLLHFPDPLLYERSDYAIRLANKDVWEETTGMNNLLATLTVK
jgi:hypothetical protein